MIRRALYIAAVALAFLGVVISFMGTASSNVKAKGNDDGVLQRDGEGR